MSISCIYVCMFIFCLHITFISVCITHMDYILCSLGSSVLFCRWGFCEVKGPLPRPVTHRISVDAHVDSRGPCYDRVQHGVPQLGEVLSWNTVSGTLAASNTLYPMGTVDPGDH